MGLNFSLYPGHATRKYQATKMKDDKHFLNRLAVYLTLALTFQIMIINKVLFLKQINNEKLFCLRTEFYQLEFDTTFN